MSMRAILIVVAALVLCGPCRAQGEPRVLYSTSAGVFTSAPIASALRELDIDPVFAANSRETRDALRDGVWDLMIVRRTIRYEALYESEILALLEAHVASGGALHFQMADLELVPDGWYDLLGLEGAVDLELPLSDIRLTPPQHPSVAGGGFLRLTDELFPPDYGDELVAKLGTRVTQEYVTSEMPSSVLSISGRVLVNGQQWDNWAPGSSAFLVAGQIRWLLRCPADLDLDGVLTINDFLVFQNLFAVDDPSVDFDGDGVLTIFDFLEFFNRFNAGC